MALKLKNPPGLSNRTITLPSAGYPYRAFPDLRGGQINVKAFTYEIESLMFGATGDNTAKQYAKLCLLLQKLVEWPRGFNPGELLEGDSTFIVMTARALTYPEQYHTFETACDHCGEKESHNLKIPDHLPQNRYPEDFRGYATFTTFNENVLDMRFLTLNDDSECLRMSRTRVQKNIISDDAQENDYQLNRLSIGLISANGEKPATLEEARSFFKEMPADERDEIMRAVRLNAPGLNSRLTIRCPKCNEMYEAFIPITMDFFRSRSRTIRTELPGGVCIGVPGPDQRSISSNGAPATGHAPDPRRDEGRRSQGPAGSPPTPPLTSTPATAPAPTPSTIVQTS
jgi:hypothetical protein